MIWPGDHTELDVKDSWSAVGKVDRTWIAYRLVLNGTKVGIVKENLSKAAYSVDPYISAAKLREGVCTHQDVRDVLALALEVPAAYEHIKLRLGQQMRAFIVDEVYDANDLDLAVIDAAVEAGVRVTLVGDLWQALYVFRGARPEVVPEFLDRQHFRTLRLSHSFRWGTESQRQLASALRQGGKVELPTATHDGDLAGLDVVLALEWAPLWELGPGVLPIGFKSFKGGYEEAAAILVLNHVTQSVFSVEATYLGDALTSLGVIDEDDFLPTIGARLHAIVETLRSPGASAVRDAYAQLAALVAQHTTRALRKAHPAHTGRLAMVQQRLLFSGRPVPGLTTHQAKGGEWDAVGVKLADTHRARLAAGLSVEAETDRKLYVACTRARLSTVEVV